MTATGPADAARLFAARDWPALRRFVERTIGHGFRLAVVEVASLRHREEILDGLRAATGGSIASVALDRLPGLNLWEELTAGLGDAWADAQVLAISGLEDEGGRPRDLLMRQLNVQRDLFVRDVRLPWIVFIHPAAAVDFRMFAPDFCDFATLWLSAVPPRHPDDPKLSPVLAAASDALREGRQEDAETLLDRHGNRSGLSREERAHLGLLQGRLARLRGRITEAEAHLARARGLADDDPFFLDDLDREQEVLGARSVAVPLVFVLSAPEDAALLVELEHHLRPLQAQGLLSVVTERHMSPGTDIQQWLMRHLERADLVVPLVSSALLGSPRMEEIVAQAMRRERAGQTRVAPVILRPCLWQLSSLGDRRVLPPDGDPVTVWPDRSEAWRAVVSGLASVLGPPAGAAEAAPAMPMPAVRSSRVTEERVALLLLSLAEERRALLAEVRSQGIEIARGEVAGRDVDMFHVQGRGGDAFCVVVGTSREVGGHAGQLLVRDLAQALHPDLVFLVGACGGLPEHGARDNSVLLPRQVFSYEAERLQAGQAIAVSTGFRPSAHITDLANALFDAVPDVHLIMNKDYAIGEKLLDALRSDQRALLLAMSPEVVGFEAEGAGMLHALIELQRQAPHVDAGIVKGVSDFADRAKRPHPTQATRRAVRVVLELLRRS